MKSKACNTLVTRIDLNTSQAFRTNTNAKNKARDLGGHLSYR